MIFNLHLGVSHSVLCQMEGAGYVFSNHHILKCSGSPPTPVTFDQSLSNRKVPLEILYNRICRKKLRIPCSDWLKSNAMRSEETENSALQSSTEKCCKPPHGKSQLM